MATTSQRQKGALSLLNAAIDALKFTKISSTGTTPTKALVGSVGTLLATIRVYFLILQR